MSTSLNQPERLRAWDYALLGGICAVLFGYALIETRPLTMHESVLPENSREMMMDHDWLVPKYGGQPWLERPPLPQWMTVGVAALVGHCDREWIVRTPVVLLGIFVVLLVAWMTSLWYGRGLGMMTGFVLATMWEFYTYASDAEADMFLCAIVTGAIALFVYLEFAFFKPAAERSEAAGSEAQDPVSFFGRRSWRVLAFFVLFAMTNLAKGLIFGTLMVAVPISCFLLWNLNLHAIRRYVWLWGWLAFAVVALAWPFAVYQQYPDVIELWASDYMGRLNQGFIREPAWYYAVTLPWVMLPWTLPALVGLWVTRGAAMKERQSPERFLWCWAVLTPIIFSIPQGKHHHYLLQCLAPWAVLASIGSMRIWQAIAQAPTWLRNPTLSLRTALAIDLTLAVLHHRIPGPVWVLPVLLVLCPIAVFLLHWGLVQPQARTAFVTVGGVLVALHCLLYSYKTHYLDRYQDDTAFLLQARKMVPGEILVNYDDHTLEGFRVLFYLRRNAALLHNFTYLLDQQITDREVYIVARAKHEELLTKLGSAQVLLQSKHTRGESWPGDRWTLFALRFRDDLARLPADKYIRPMQASGRAPGPFLVDKWWK
jgi:4-amino-4-deoxy-L-arabinose transferase-like glycosyltransferase